ncbi:MAG: ABC transporter permease subunit [Deltaproteobacteria bacterium]|nr:ABC transporter permease subunit [Deltaproteobacteria bacterium]
MNALWVIFVDTWRQSRQQVVLIVLLVLLALMAGAWIALPRTIDGPGEPARIGLWISEGPADFLEELWVGTCAQARLQREGERFDAADLLDAGRLELRLGAAKAEIRLHDTTPQPRRVVEILFYLLAQLIFTLSMLLFIGASAGYFPGMLEAGAIEALLARPISRLQVFAGKYVGGLALYTVAISATYLIVFVGIGLRTGVWHTGVFFVLPLQVFTAAVLYALLAALGVATRNGLLCLLVGLGFYLVVDTALATLLQLEELGVFAESSAWGVAADVLYFGLPNFGLLKSHACASVLAAPSVAWPPFAVAAAWLLLALAFGTWKFRRTDY